MSNSPVAGHINNENDEPDVDESSLGDLEVTNEVQSDANAEVNQADGEEINQPINDQSEHPITIMNRWNNMYAPFFADQLDVAVTRALSDAAQPKNLNEILIEVQESFRGEPYYLEVDVLKLKRVVHVWKGLSQVRSQYVKDVTDNHAVWISRRDQFVQHRVIRRQQRAARNVAVQNQSLRTRRGVIANVQIEQDSDGEFPEQEPTVTGASELVELAVRVHELIPRCEDMFKARDLQLKEQADKAKADQKQARKDREAQLRRERLQDRMNEAGQQAADAPLGRSMFGVNTALLNFSAHLIEQRNTFSRAFEELRTKAGVIADEKKTYRDLQTRNLNELMSYRRLKRRLVVARLHDAGIEPVDSSQLDVDPEYDMPDFHHYSDDEYASDTSGSQEFNGTP